MKREFLEGLGLSEEQMEQIMKEHGKSVEKYKKDAEAVSTLKETAKQLKEQLDGANAQIAEFQSMDIESVKKSAGEWKEKAEKAQREAQEKIADMELNSLLREKLSGEKFTSEYARHGVFEEVKANVRAKDGKLFGYEEALSAVREAQPAAFEPQTPQPTFSQGTPGTPQTAEDVLRAAMGLSGKRT